MQNIQAAALSDCESSKKIKNFPQVGLVISSRTQDSKKISANIFLGKDIAHASEPPLQVVFFQFVFVIRLCCTQTSSR